MQVHTHSADSTPTTGLALARRRGAIRLRDAMAQGIHPEVLRRLVASVELVRPLRGVYGLPDRDVTQRVDLAQAAMLIPGGVICLLSALMYHQFGR